MGVVYWMLTTKGATCDSPLVWRVVCCHGNHRYHGNQNCHVNPDGQNNEIQNTHSTCM